MSNPFTILYADEEDRAIRQPGDLTASAALQLLRHGWNVALVGVCGSGKSSVMTRIEEAAPGTWCEDNWTAGIEYPEDELVVIGVYPHDAGDIPPTFARLPIDGLGGPTSARAKASATTDDARQP